MGKMIIVASGKGGTGKTTFTSQVGTVLANMGYLTALVDADAGFRNLDIALGLESQVVYDYSDYINRGMDLDQIMVRSSTYENLYFVAAPQSAATSDFAPEKTKEFWDRLKNRFDFVLADAPAGMGDGFIFAANHADEGIIVSLAEAASLRDADRVTEELENNGVETIRLCLNRIRPELIEQKSLMNVDDCIDVLSIPILGIIPDDIKVTECVAGGKHVEDTGIGAGRAFVNIASRLSGTHVPMMDIDNNTKKGLFSRIKKHSAKAKHRKGRSL